MSCSAVPFRLAMAALCAVASGAAPAAPDEGALPVAVSPDIESIVVIASSGAQREVHGAGQFLDQTVLARHGYDDINRALRQVPGLNIVEEEGFGLRPSIGIRGSGSERNTKIAVLEDGVPIAPAPYAAPAAYYFPRMPRITAVEVSKGPAAIKYGPQTVAGAVGLYTAPIPATADARPAGRAEVTAGEFGTYRGHVLISSMADIGRGLDGGFSLETLQERSSGFKELDSGGDTGFRIHDYVAKIALRTRDGAAVPQSAEIKFQQSDERAEETYLGLALDDFRRDPYRRYRGSQLDQLDVDHDTAQLTHRIAFSDRVDLTTVAYHTRTERAWYKLNDVRNSTGTGYTSISSVLADPQVYPVEYAAIVGNPGEVSAPDALRVRNNAREYFATGMQSLLGIDLRTGGIGHNIELSLRHHRDEEDRFQNDDRYQMADGRMVLTSAGAPGTQDNRLGEAEAWSAYVRDTIDWGRWSVTPGVRYESMNLQRTDWGSADTSRNGSGTVERNSVATLLPGLGVTYALDEQWMLVGGVHRGFVNPAPGSDASEEKSWSYELGLRYQRSVVQVEAFVFHVDYENLVGTCTASTGGNCAIGDQYDGGSARVRGLEFAASWDPAAHLGLDISLPLSVVYTLTDSEFRDSFDSDFDEWGEVESGDNLPFVSPHQLTVSAGLEGRRWRVHLAANYVDDARSVAGSGPIPVTQRIDARTLIDLTAQYELSAKFSLISGVRNVTDEVYNIGFRPAGARPGMPRSVLAGLRYRF